MKYTIVGGIRGRRYRTMNLSTVIYVLSIYYEEIKLPTKKVRKRDGYKYGR